MKHYVGIDLGTTNSAVSTFDGSEIRLYKSPEQNDVTPSAIFIDKRGNKYVGQRAYDNAARSPQNAATGFKRFMGTSAGLGKVALMQEPVAAVMSVMRQRKNDGMFLVYDLGGGTLDIAIAESISGRVSLMAHGGIAMCGGRDFDRILMDNVVKPWLLNQFDLPDDFSVDKDYTTLRHMAGWATEKAKIELSSKDESE